MTGPTDVANIIDFLADEEMLALFRRNRDEFERQWRKKRRAQFKARRADGALVLEMIAAGQRSVAKRLHLDVGGSADAMMRLCAIRSASK